MPIPAGAPRSQRRSLTFESNRTGPAAPSVGPLPALPGRRPGRRPPFAFPTQDSGLRTQDFFFDTGLRTFRRLPISFPTQSSVLATFLGWTPHSAFHTPHFLGLSHYESAKSPTIHAAFTLFHDKRKGGRGAIGANLTDFPTKTGRVGRFGSGRVL